MTAWGRPLALAILLSLGLTGCMQRAEPVQEEPPPSDEMPPPDSAPVPNVRVEELSSRFDANRAATLAASAQAAESRGDWATALEGYRQAALTAPDDPALWDGLERMARLVGDTDLASDARFMAARAGLQDRTGAIYGNRVGESALRGYLAQAEGNAAISDDRRLFVAALADRYTLVRAGDGVYEAPPTIDIDRREYPAVAVGLALAIGYPAVIFSSGGGDD